MATSNLNPFFFKLLTSVSVFFLLKAEAKSAEHITLSVENCMVTSRQIWFDVLIVNDGDEPLTFNSAFLQLTHSAAIAPAGTHNYSFSYISGSSDFPACFATPGTSYVLTYTPASNLMELSMATTSYTNLTAIQIPVGGPPMKIGRFSLKVIDTVWVSGASVDLGYLSSGNGIHAYINGASAFSDMDQTTTGIFAAIDPCLLIIPAGCNVTSTVNSIRNENCFQDSSGSATVVLTGARPDVTWIVNNVLIPDSDSVIILDNLTRGIYVFEYYDSLGCAGIDSFSIDGPINELTMTDCSHINVTCNGGSDGSVSAGAISNAVGNINYSWENSSGIVVGTTAVVNNLPADTYTLTVSDDCATRTCVKTIMQPNFLTVSACAKTNAKCPGTSSGSVIAGTINNAIGSLSYVWKNSSAAIVGTTANVSNLPAGTYNLTVTDSCGSATCTVTIAEPLPLTMAACTHTNVSCPGASTGSVTAGAISNATGSVTYSWKNSSGTVVGTTASVSGLPAGIYDLTVADSCSTVTCSDTIFDSSSALSMTACSHTNASCTIGNDGTVSAGTVSNGNGPITYSWVNNSNIVVGTTATVSNLPVGTYTLTVSDACGSLTCSQTIGLAAVFSMSACSHTNVTCPGGNNGTATAGTLTNASGTISYSWADSTGAVVSSSPTASNLSAGVYTLTVSDACGSLTCSATIIQPAALSMTACSGTNLTCNGSTTGAVNAGTVSNSIGPISYRWTDSLGSVVGTTASVTNLPAGIYHLSVSDSCSTLGCSYTITQPDSLLTISACSHTDVLCSGGSTGSVTAGAVSNAIGTVTFAWRDSMGTIVGNTPTVSNLPAGTYTLTVSDLCKSLTCSQTILAPGAPLSLAGCTHTNATCIGTSTGSASAGIVLNPVGTISYSWRNSNNILFGTTATISNLPADTYTLTVTDACGIATCSQTVTQPGSSMSMGACTHTNINCSGGNSGSVSAGPLFNTSGTVTYEWRNSSNVIVGTTATVTGLPIGTYSLIVRDLCSSDTCSTTITGPNGQLSLSPCSHTDVTCHGNHNGTLTAGLVSNSFGTVNYIWKNSLNATVGNSAFVSNLPPDMYTLTVTDNCASITCTEVISEPDPLTMSSCTYSDVTCNGTASGTATAGSLSGAVGNVVYSWRNSSNTVVSQNATAANLPAGTYTLTVSDNCASLTCSQVIGQPAPFTMGSCLHSDAGCFGSSTGSVSAGAITGVSGPINYIWEDSNAVVVGTTSIVPNLPAGSYFLTVYTICGTKTCVQTISQFPEMTMAPCTASDACFGGSNGSVAAGSITGNVGAPHYSWYDSQNNLIGTTALKVDLTPGDYTLIVSDNCTSDTCMQTVGVSDTIETSFATTACDSYMLPWGTIAGSSGDYSNSYTSSAGCDSIVTAHVSIFNNVSYSYSDSAINTYTLPWGIVVTATGDYSHLYMTPEGCDSTVTVHVDITIETGVPASLANEHDYFEIRNGSVFLTGRAENAELFTIHGQQVAMNNLTTGIYLLRIIEKNRIFIFKIHL